MKEFLGNIQELPMPEQSSVLASKFKAWQGDLEQVDDVLVIGIKV